MNEKLILVSNDDGITSSGIQTLARAMAPLGDVYVIAPDREQSAASHSISLSKPLRMVDVMPGQYAVDGTPTDCIYLGLHHVLPRRPDLIVSGINHGANLGNDVTYSGTVAAAMEGTLFGVPSIAFSQTKPSAAGLEAAGKFATRLAQWVFEHGLPSDTLLNVNFPPVVEPERFAWVKLGRRHYGDSVDVRIDPRGKKYYWIGGNDLGSHDVAGSDGNALAEGFITLTPVHMDLTNHESLTKLRDVTTL